MKTFAEFLNDEPATLKTSWQDLEDSWTRFLHDLHAHVDKNAGKYDAHHAKFGNFTGEHPDEQLGELAKGIDDHFKRMKEALSRLGAHEMI